MLFVDICWFVVLCVMLWRYDEYVFDDVYLVGFVVVGEWEDGGDMVVMVCLIFMLDMEVMFELGELVDLGGWGSGCYWFSFLCWCLFLFLVFLGVVF